MFRLARNLNNELFELIETIIRNAAAKRKKTYSYSDDYIEDMIDHSIKMYEERLAERLVDTLDSFNRHPESSIQSYIGSSVGCCFANFGSKRSKGLV